MKVLDRDGQELRIASRVERSLGSLGRGGVQGVVTHAGKQVDVTWATSSGASAKTYGTVRDSLFGRVRRCWALQKRGGA